MNPIGFVIVDRYTQKLDWDGELHPTKADAIASLTGPGHMWCETLEEENEDRTYYGKFYTICPVGQPGVEAVIEDIRQRASVECETDEDFAQAEADRDTLLTLLGATV